MDSKNQKVAQFSRLCAEEYINSKNFGRAFSHFLIALKLNPSWKSELKESMSTVLCEWGNILEHDKRYDDLFNCYQQALEVFPDNEFILNNLGAHLLRLGFMKEAANYFHKCLSLQPDFLRAMHNLDNLANLAVPRWHFRMLNDSMRNVAFREAIRKKVEKGLDIVLDIGTGTAILSLFALESGAKEVVGCDSSPFMFDIATQVLKANNAQSIRLINKHSSDLTIPEDISERAKLVVTETVDSGLLGEGILDTLIDAWNRLLKISPAKSLSFEGSGSVIPLGAELFIMGIECDTIARKYSISDDAKSCFQLFNCSIMDYKNYDCEMLKSIPNGFRCLTNTYKTSFINFNDPESMKRISLGNWYEIITFKCSGAGRLDCFALWFDLYVDEDIILNTGPDSNTSDSWDQAIFPCSFGRHVNKNDQITLKLSFNNGKLVLSFLNDETPVEAPNKEVNLFSPSEEIMEMINSERCRNYFSGMAKVMLHKLGDSALILDTFPFPLFGLNYLTGKRRKSNLVISMVRSENDASFIKFIMEKYNLENQVRFITEDGISDLSSIGKFDVILLDLIEKSGELRDKFVFQMDYLKSLLRENGLLLPEKVTVIGQLLDSDWLEKTTAVLNDEVTCNFKVSQFVNTFQVKRHIDFELSSISKIPRSQALELFDITQGQFSCNKRFPISIAGNINALAYWYQINFIHDYPHVSTFYDFMKKQSALLISKRYVVDFFEFKIIYDNGLFKIVDLLNSTT